MTHTTHNIATNSDLIRPILRQTEVEQQMLRNAKDGLLATLNWETTGDTFCRKLSSLRFAARTYRDHLERALANEEHDGYMEFAIELCPQFSEKIQRLRSEHNGLRDKLEVLITRLERLMPNDHAGLQQWRKGMLGLLQSYDEHSHRETCLIQDAFSIDFGGGD